MFHQAFEAAARFAEDPSGWLVLCGPSGSGKTHLAVATANRCIERGTDHFLHSGADLLDHLRATFSPDSDVSYDDLFEQVRNVPILILDDLGSQSSSPWAQEKLFQVINHRFSRELPTVVTVRGPLQRLDETLRTRVESKQGISSVFHLGQYNSRFARGIGDIPAEMLRRMTFESFNPLGALAPRKITECYYDMPRMLLKSSPVILKAGCCSLAHMVVVKPTWQWRRRECPAA